MGQRVWPGIHWGEYLLRRHNGVSAGESLCEGWYYGAGYLFWGGRRVQWDWSGMWWGGGVIGLW